jgi:hypothetical protein
MALAPMLPGEGHATLRKRNEEVAMGRVTVGDELRWLFQARETGALSTREFEARKHELLDWSKCQLLRTLPKRMQWPRH